MMTGRLDLEVGAAADRGAERDQQLREDRDRSGRPGTLLCPAPFRTGRAAFTASGSSKPLGTSGRCCPNGTGSWSRRPRQLRLLREGHRPVRPARTRQRRQPRRAHPRASAHPPEYALEDLEAIAEELPAALRQLSAVVAFTAKLDQAAEDLARDAEAEFDHQERICAECGNEPPAGQTWRATGTATRRPAASTTSARTVTRRPTRTERRPGRRERRTAARACPRRHAQRKWVAPKDNPSSRTPRSARSPRPSARRGPRTRSRRSSAPSAALRQPRRHAARTAATATSSPACTACCCAPAAGAGTTSPCRPQSSTPASPA